MKKIIFNFLIVFIAITAKAQQPIVCFTDWSTHLPRHSYYETMRDYTKREEDRKAKAVISDFPFQSFCCIDNTKFYLSVNDTVNIPSNGRIFIKLKDGTIVKGMRQCPASIQHDVAEIYYYIPEFTKIVAQEILKIRIEKEYLFYKDYEIKLEHRQMACEAFKASLEVLEKQYQLKSKLKSDFTYGF